MRALKKKEQCRQTSNDTDYNSDPNNTTIQKAKRAITEFFTEESESSELSAMLQKHREHIEELRLIESKTPLGKDNSKREADAQNEPFSANNKSLYDPENSKENASQSINKEVTSQGQPQLQHDDKAKISCLLEDMKRNRTDIMALLNNVLAVVEQKPKRWPIKRGDSTSAVSMLIPILNTLFAAERPLAEEQSRDSSVQTNEDGTPRHIGTPFLDDVRAWILHVASTFLTRCNSQQCAYLLLCLLQTPCATTWGTSLLDHPMAPLNDQKTTSNMDSYITALYFTFDHDLYPAEHCPRWTEDDYVASLDILSVEKSYSTFLETPIPQMHPLDFGSDTWAGEVGRILLFSNHLIDALLAGIRSLSGPGNGNLTKHLAQTTVKVAQRLAEHATDNLYTKKCQTQIDAFMTKVVLGFLEENSSSSLSHFLPALPYRIFSVEALWQVTLRMLLVDDTASSSLPKDVLTNLPNLSPFLRLLATNHTQGVFILSCLSNILICTPTISLDKVDSNPSQTSLALITVVAHTLFTVAFIDKELRDIYYKDVRDHFDPICDRHPFVMSLLLRWTYNHFSTVEQMALYLFRSLPLKRWEISKDDLGLLLNLIRRKPATSVTVTFARFVVEGLNFGYRPTEVDAGTSKTQSWHPRRRLFLPYETHQDIAFLLLDACQQLQPLSDKGDKAGAVAPHLSKADMPKSSSSHQLGNVAGSTTDFIDWAWRTALQLKLYDCPVSSRAAESEQHTTLSLLKEYLNHPVDSVAQHGALVTYVHFMLSLTSRHFLQFEAGNGWMKVLLFLRRGKSEAVIQVLCEVIPVFVYLYGDDFFLDESLSDFLRHIAEFKSDPMLVKAANTCIPKPTLFLEKDRMSGVALIVGSNAWQGYLIDSTSDLNDTSGRGFSYCDLMVHSWLKTVFRKQDWMWNESYVAIVDCICKVAFSLSRARLVQTMLAEELKLLKDGKAQQTGQAVKPGAMSQQRNPLRLIKSMIPDIAYMTLLVGEWSMLSLTTSNIFKTPSVERNSLWFAFEALMLETSEEQAYRRGLAQQVTTMGKDTLQEAEVSALFKSLDAQYKKPLEYMAIYRWLQHILAIPANHPLLPLFLQVFFCLYFANVAVDDGTIFYGHLFFIKKHPDLQKLRDHIAHLQTYHGQQQAAKEANTLTPSEYNHSETLRQIYYAMWLWLGDSNIVQSGKISDIPSHYCPNRLSSCTLHGTFDQWESQQAWNDTNSLWLDLVRRDKLENEFRLFPWEGSAKFRTKNIE